MQTELNIIDVFTEAAHEVDENIRFGPLTEETQLTAIGIDSITVVEVIGEMERMLDIRIPDEQLSRLKTLADLSAIVREQRS